MSMDRTMMIDIDEKTFRRLDREIKKKHYNTKRYGSEYTFALLYTDTEIEKNRLGEFLRLSDFFLSIDEHYYFIVFNYTNESAAFKASENLLFKIDNYLGNTNSYIAIDRVNKTESTRSTINRLYQILEIAKKHGYNRVEDENVLNEVI